MPKTRVVFDGPAGLEQVLAMGERLWHEEAKLRSPPGRDLEDLWECAAEMMDPVRKEAAASRLEQLIADHPELDYVTPHLSSMREPAKAHQMALVILSNGLLPKWWEPETPFPYQGLFVSAFYLMETKNHLEAGEGSSAWASLTQAYYHLGTNSSATTIQEAAAAAARSRASTQSHELRARVVQIAESLRGDKGIRSLADAIEETALIMEGDEYNRAILMEFDQRTSQSSKKTKPGAEPSSPEDRLRKNLANWCAPSSPYPEVRDAFEPFKQKRRQASWVLPRNHGRL